MLVKGKKRRYDGRASWNAFNDESNRSTSSWGVPAGETVAKESRTGVMSLAKWAWINNAVQGVGAASVEWAGKAGASGGIVYRSASEIGDGSAMRL